MLTIEPLTPEEHKHFWSRVGAPDPETGCMEWTRYVEPSGYAKYSHRGSQVRAHRLAYVDTHGAIPEGLVIDHTCNNRACCNPSHLRAVSNWENVARGSSPVAENSRKTHCTRGHLLAGDNVYVPPKRPTQRECKRCRKGRQSGKH